MLLYIGIKQTFKYELWDMKILVLTFLFEVYKELLLLECVLLALGFSNIMRNLNAKKWIWYINERKWTIVFLGKSVPNLSSWWIVERAANIWNFRRNTHCKEYTMFLELKMRKGLLSNTKILSTRIKIPSSIRWYNLNI